MTRVTFEADHRSARDLANIVLTMDDADEADSVYWNAMSTLYRRGTREIFDEARDLCVSECPFEQRIGCNILAQLGSPERPFAAESFPLVASIACKTDNLDTLTCALCAMGWLRDARGVDVALALINHPDDVVRYWVSHVLTALDEDPRSIEGLIRLTSDSSDLVRDWATFGLGTQTDADSPAIREALVARLDDVDVFVRGEALVGLAKRQDERVVEPLRRAFESGIYAKGPSDYATDALCELSDIERFPQLSRWKSKR